MEYPVTPDGRYFVVRGRLWRRSNPALAAVDKKRLINDLMNARRSLTRTAGLGAAERRIARAKVEQAKVALGEPGHVWWTDGAPDYNRKMVVNSPYRDWFQTLPPCNPAGSR